MTVKVKSGTQGPEFYIVAQTITRATTASPAAYAAGKVIADAVNGPVGVLSPILRSDAGLGVITGARLTKSGAVTANAKFRVHFFSAAPTGLTADYASLSAATGIKSYVGSIDFDMTDASARLMADGVSVIPIAQLTIPFTTQALYFAIECLGAYQPAAGEVFTLGIQANG